MPRNSIAGGGGIFSLPLVLPMVFGLNIIAMVADSFPSNLGFPV